MFLTNINGEKLSINVNTQDHTQIKQELNKKYGYDIEKMYLHWNGRHFIVGFCEKEMKQEKINDIVFLKTKIEEIEIDVDFYKEVLLNKSQLAEEEKTVICKNLDKILESVFKDLKHDF